MPARRKTNTYRPSEVEAAHAKVMAAKEELTAAMQDEPMRRWPHPIPTAAAASPARWPESETSPTLTQVLEHLQYQNQVLTDLLAAVNSLTAALLCQKGSGGE